MSSPEQQMYDWIKSLDDDALAAAMGLGGNFRPTDEWFRAMRNMSPRDIKEVFGRKDREPGTRGFGDHLDKLGVTPGELSVRRLPADDLDESAEMVVCEICEVPLNRFLGPDGFEWVHSRAWQTYDHDPIPKSVERPAYHLRKDLLCDFCGLSTINNPVIWSYTGDRIVNTSGNLDSDHGKSWAACQPCADIIDTGDVDRLIERVMSASSVMRAVRGHPEAEAVMRNQMYRTHWEFVPSITAKTYIGPPVKPSQLNPRMMPKIQAGLLKYWSKPELYDDLIKPGRGFTYSTPGMHVGWDRPQGVEHFIARFTDDNVMPSSVFDKHVKHLRTGIEFAELFWIDSRFTTESILAGHDLKDVSIAREELPSAHGLIIYEDPIGTIKRPHGEAGIRAVSWTLVPEGVWINFYIQGEDADPEVRDVAAFRAENGFLLCPNIGTGIPFVGLGDVDDDFRAHPGAGYLLTLIATWSFMNEPGIAEHTVMPVDKKQQRAAKRSGRKIPDVVVVSLRKRAPARPRNDSEQHRELKYRKKINGHWKMQFYGPKRGLRKRIYIRPYIARPDLPPPPPKAPVVKVLR